MSVLKIYFCGVGGSVVGGTLGYFIYRHEEISPRQAAYGIAGVAMAWPIVIPPLLLTELDSLVTGSRWKFNISISRYLPRPEENLSSLPTCESTGALGSENPFQ